MIILKILLYILLAIFILLCLKLSVKIGYDGEVTLSAGVLGLYFKILPAKEKPYPIKDFTYEKYHQLLEADRLEALRKEQEKKAKAEKKKKDKAKKSKEKKKKLPTYEMKNAPNTIKIILSIVGRVIEKFFGIIHIKIVRMHITVGGPDAATAALTYAAVSQGVAYLLEILAHKTRFKRIHNTQVTVEPDFLLDTVQADVCIIVQIRLIELIGVGTYFLYHFMKERRKRVKELRQQLKAQQNAQKSMEQITQNNQTKEVTTNE